MSLLTTVAPDHRIPDRRVEGRPHPDARPPLRLVEPPTAAKPRMRVGLVGSVAFVLVLLGVFALAAVHTLVVQAQFELDRLDQQVVERQGELDALRLEVATLEAPAAITSAAADLGLVAPTDRVHLEPVVSPPPLLGVPAVDRS